MRQAQADIVERVCAVCNGLYERSRCQVFKLAEFSDTVLRHMQQRLRPRPEDNLPAALVRQYDVRPLWPDEPARTLLQPFGDMLLSRAGFRMHFYADAPEPLPSICICDSCYGSLGRQGRHAPGLPPCRECWHSKHLPLPAAAGPRGPPEALARSGC
jgi:hypothetical protein